MGPSEHKTIQILSDKRRLYHQQLGSWQDSNSVIISKMTQDTKPGEPSEKDPVEQSKDKLIPVTQSGFFKASTHEKTSDLDLVKNLGNLFVKKNVK
jgi:hypothetical protein